MTTATTIGAIVMTPLLCKLLLGAVVPVDAVGIAVSTIQVWGREREGWLGELGLGEWRLLLGVLWEGGGGEGGDELVAGEYKEESCGVSRLRRVRESR